MAWTAPKTFTANTVLTAADLNAYLRDNLLETAPAKATTTGSWFVGAGPNQIQERVPQLASIAASETCTSSSWGDLETPGPTVTVNSGVRALIIISAAISSNSLDAQSFVGYTISGATTQIATFDLSLQVDGISADKTNRRCQIFMQEDLTPGLNTFTTRYTISSGISTFSDRFIGVWPF